MNIKYISNFTIIGFLLVFNSIFTQCVGKDRVEETLKAYVVKENATYPVMADAVTRLDSCSLVDARTIRYNYTYTDTQIAADTFEIKSSLKRLFANSIKIETGSTYMRTNRISFQYVFYNNKKEYLFMVNVDAEDYQ